MEYLQNGFTLELSQGAFPLSTDSIALSEFVRLPKNASVLDLGAGCGTLGMLLCAKDSLCKVTGIEIDPDAHNMALENARRNDITDRYTSLLGDLRQTRQDTLFDVILSNPPYFSGGPAGKRCPTARREDLCSPKDLFACAQAHLKFGGDFYLVHKPERLAQLIALGAQHQMEAKRLRLLRHRTDGPISLILLQLRKGAKPGLIIEEEALYDTNGDATPYYHTLYHE